MAMVVGMLVTMSMSYDGYDDGVGGVAGGDDGRWWVRPVVCGSGGCGRWFAALVGRAGGRGGAWYFCSLLYLLWKTPFPTIAAIFPSTVYSSIELLSLHLVILWGLWTAPPEYPYESDKSQAKTGEFMGSMSVGFRVQNVSVWEPKSGHLDVELGLKRVCFMAKVEVEMLGFGC
ncbi:hypothetical protein Tco_0139033 [Tanacetum coccineum]